ncbi:hypothetical protein [Martelella limonii]|uniref:hypothetical protein n=1 Tax=Martelella limonii TaxID=1647649 RepID=UPI0015811281|nr:hypothetical protein [Martelella limonii]
MSDTDTPLQFLGIEQSGENWIVEFAWQTTGPFHEWLKASIKVPVETADEDILRVGRAFFHDICERALAETKDWKISEDELAKLISSDS